MERRAYLAGLAGTATAGLSGCVGLLGSTNDGCTGDCDVGMSARDFRPETVETTVGETVVWKNTSSKGHTVTAYGSELPEGAAYFASGGYESEDAARSGFTNSFGGRIDPGQTYEHTFEVAGEFPYFCIPHEPQNMVGAVVVEEE